ncbi:hypothetical protein SKa4_00150 [Pseudomonas phage vB_PpuM-SKa-4]
MARLDMNKVTDHVKMKTGMAPVFSVTSALVINDSTARVVGKFSKAPKSVEEARVAIAKAFDNRISPVTESFTVIGRGAHSSAIEVSGFLALNREIRGIDKNEIGTNAETARYREMAGNVMMDNVDHTLWDLTIAESGAHTLSRASNHQLADLVSMAAVEDRGAKHVADVMPLLDVMPDPRNAVYASFFSTETDSVNYGYVVTADTIYSTDTMQTESVHRGQLISVVQLAGADSLANIPMPVEDQSGDVVEYYSELCKANPQFYMDLDNQLSEQTVA